MNDRPDKDLAEAQARTALIGGTLEALEDDRGRTVYVLTRHHVTRQLRTLDEVSVWLDKLSGKVTPSPSFIEAG